MHFINNITVSQRNYIEAFLTMTVKQQKESTQDCTFNSRQNRTIQTQQAAVLWGTDGLGDSRVSYILQSIYRRNMHSSENVC